VDAFGIAAAKLSGDWTEPVPPGQRGPPPIPDDPQRIHKVCEILAEIGALESVLFAHDVPFPVIREVLARHRWGEFNG
jgi:hypothetical protein